MNKRKAGFSLAAMAAAFAILIANILAITPHLHQRLHGASSHECVVTLIAAGKYDHPAPAASSVALDCLMRGSMPFSQPCPIFARALEFSLREHAPPAIS
jgi:hypothetical protein